MMATIHPQCFFSDIHGFHPACFGERPGKNGWKLQSCIPSRLDYLPTLNGINLWYQRRKIPYLEFQDT